MKHDHAMRLIGAGLILHGSLHALAGVRSTDLTQFSSADSFLLWLVTALWVVASVGFIAAGFGYIGVDVLISGRRKFARAAAVTSAAFLILFWHTWWIAPALLVDFFTLGCISGAIRENHEGPRATKWFKSWRTIAFVSIAYAFVVIAVRPVHMRWGSSADEIDAMLPGDPAFEPNYKIQHAVTLDASAQSVWPWLAQLGHDQGGFYSYSRLENLFGLHIRNATAIHDEWQRNLKAGDSIFATPSNYLGTGRRFGWKISGVEKNKVLVLDNWGAFVLDSLGPNYTRLIVRTANRSRDDFKSLLLTPLSVAVLEPAHFIMQRKMLNTIKARVESREI